MEEFFAAIEQARVSVWMREGPYAYFIALIFHAIGMAVFVGGGVVVSLRLLGVGRTATLAKFRGLLPVMWWGAAIAIVSGLLLLVAYPAKALTNPLFAIKLASLAAAAVLVARLVRSASGDGAQRQQASTRHRLLAALALVLWFTGVAAGKLLLHTYTVLQVS